MERLAYSKRMQEASNGRRSFTSRLDATDVRILRSMGMLPFQRVPRDLDDLKPPGIAKRLGISQRTIKDRLSRMSDEGVLSGFEAYPNLRLLGLSWKSFHFRVTSRPKARVIADVSPVEGLVSVMDFLGPDVCMDLYYRDEGELDRRLRLLTALTGGARPVEWFDNRMPETATALSPLDWRILCALRGDALKGTEEVAGEVGVTSRTVRRRMGRMLAGGALDVVPVVDFGRASNVIPFALLLVLTSEEAPSTVRALLQMHESRYFWHWRPPTREIASFVVFLHATHTGEIEEMRRRAEGISGVARAEAIVPSGGFENGAWLSDVIARRAAAPGASGRDRDLSGAEAAGADASAGGRPSATSGQVRLPRVPTRRSRGRKP